MSRLSIPDSIKTISHPVRQSVLKELKSGKKNAKELERILEVNIYTLYHHLNFLEEKGFITSESLNGEKYYDINIDKPDLSAYESIIELIAELQIDKEYELIKIGIPDDSQLISDIDNKLQELNTLISSAKGVTKNYLIFLKRKQSLDNGGKVMVQNLEDIVKKYVENNDSEGLDVLFTLAYQRSGITSYRTNQYSFRDQIKNCAERNLLLKYPLTEDCKLKIDILDSIILDYKYADFETLHSFLILHASELIRQNVNEIYIKLNEIDKIALKYILDYFPFKINESKEVAVKKGFVGFEYISDFNIHTKSNNTTDEKDIIYFDISELLRNLEEKNHIYGILNGGAFNINKNNLFMDMESLRYCPTLGNLLVKAGLGYWVPWVSVKGNVHYRLIVPKFLYDIGGEVIKSYSISPEQRIHGEVLEHRHSGHEYWHPASREHK